MKDGSPPVPDLEWSAGAWASRRLGCSEADVAALCRQFGAPIGYHTVARDGVTIGYAPDGDDYPIDHVIMSMG